MEGTAAWAFGLFLGIIFLILYNQIPNTKDDNPIDEKPDYCDTTEYLDSLYKNN